MTPLNPASASGLARRTRGHHASVLATKLLGCWQLDQLVGQGTFTLVYEARPLGCPPSRPADYVVKLLRPEYQHDSTAQSAMAREADVGRHSSNPHLVPILESHLDQEPAHLVMPKIHGASMAAVIQQIGAVVVPQALWLARQVAEALHHLHRQDWIHGDVKPANVMVSRQGHATLIDLAFAMRRAESIYSNGRPLMGTLSHVAPELLTSANATQPTSDIYSLGISVYEMITGQLPFPHSEAAQLVEAHLRETPPPFDRALRVPEPVEQLVRRMLSKSPIRRPQSAAELIDLLTDLEIETLQARFTNAA